MAQYAVMIFEQVAPADLPPEVMQAHGNLPKRIAEQGGRVVAGLALQPPETATSIRGDGTRHRRPVHRDQGVARRHLRDRGARPRPRARAREDDADRRRRRRGAAAARLPGPGGRLSAVEHAVADAHRREWAYVLAATVRVTRDLDAAEEAVQDAYVQALSTWADDGVPANPGAWLTTVARRGALNALRRQPDARDEAAAAAGARRAGSGRARRRRHPRRPPAARLHLLPPGARLGGAGRAHAAAGVRRGDARHRARVPRRRGDDGRAPDAREEEDRRGAHPVRRAGRRRAARARRRGADRDPPALRHRPHRATRARTWCATS